MKLQPVENKKDRRKALYWLSGAASVLLFWKFIPRKQKEEEKPVKMLTEDGRLVEVDMKYLKGERKRLKSEEFHSWVKRKK